MVSEFDRLSRATLDELLADDPVEATRLGVHGYDDRLPMPDPAALADAAQRRAALQAQWEALDEAGLSLLQRHDRQLAIIALKQASAQQAVLEPWRRAPYLYTAAVGDGLYLLMERDDTPAEQRGEAMRARLQAVPTLLTQGRRNLRNVPPVWREIALTNLRGGRQFLSDSVPAWADATLDARLAADVRRAALTAGAALAEFGDCVAALPEGGSFAAGADYFNFMLREVHLENLTADDLYAFGQEQMQAALAELRRLAAGVGTGAEWPALVAERKQHHPAGPDLLDAYREALERGKAHVLDNDLVGVPPGEQVIMTWTPSYLRATYPLGSMGTTPAFAPGFTSRFYLTAVDPAAPPERQAQHLGEHCYSFIHSIAFHEVYPGHHLQQVWHKQHPSALRRWFRSPLFLEGWGLYTEDLMAETGYFPDARDRLFMARNALWRAVRVIIDTGLHTRGMPVAEAVALLHEQVRQAPYMAEGEVRRYTTHSNPTYPSCYLLGKERIKGLREEVRRREGPSFSLRSFHDRLLAHGTMPLALHGEALLG